MQKKYTFYRIVKVIVFILGKILFRIEFFRHKKIPKTQGVIYAANHASFLDPVLVGLGAKHILTFLTCKTIFANKFLSILIKNLNAYPIDLKSSCGKKIKETEKRILTGENVLIFPEGRITRNGSFGKARRGIGLIALNTKVPIVPVYIDGTFHALHRHSKMIRPVKIKIFYGEPIFINDINFPEDFSIKDKSMFISNLVMDNIKALKAKSIKPKKIVTVTVCPFTYNNKIHHDWQKCPILSKAMEGITNITRDNSEKLKEQGFRNKKIKNKVCPFINGGTVQNDWEKCPILKKALEKITPKSDKTIVETN